MFIYARFFYFYEGEDRLGIERCASKRQDSCLSKVSRVSRKTSFNDQKTTRSSYKYPYVICVIVPLYQPRPATQRTFLPYVKKTSFWKSRTFTEKMFYTPYGSYSASQLLLMLFACSLYLVTMLPRIQCLAMTLVRVLIGLLLTCSILMRCFFYLALLKAVLRLRCPRSLSHSQ